MQIPGGDWVKIDATTGKVIFDQTELKKAGQNFKIKVTSRTYEVYTDPFKVTNQCNPYTVSPVATPNLHYVPVVPNTPNKEIILDAKLLVTPADYSSGTGTGSDVSVCPLTYTIYQNGVPAAPSTWLALGGGNNLKINVNVKDVQTGYSIRVSTPDTTFVDSNGVAGTEFDVEVKCNSVGYTVTHAGIPPLVTHKVPVPFTEPTFPLAAFTYVQPLCKAITYEFFDGQGGCCSPPTTPTPGLTTKSVPDGTVDATVATGTPATAIYANDWGKIEKYPFYIKVTLEGGQTFWAQNTAGNELFELDVVCGPFSTTISEPHVYLQNEVPVCCGPVADT